MPAIQEDLERCSIEKLVLDEDEVDIHLHLIQKSGTDRHLRGQQKRMVTSGQDEKYYLAGAEHRCIGKSSYVVDITKLIYQYLKASEGDLPAVKNHYANRK